MTSTSGVEITLAEVGSTVEEVWREVLEADEIESDTHFFEFGGHSVTAMRVMIRLRKQWQVNLPTRLIFDHPMLSDFIEALQGELAGTGVLAAVQD